MDYVLEFVETDRIKDKSRLTSNYRDENQNLGFATEPLLVDRFGKNSSRNSKWCFYIIIWKFMDNI